MPCAITTFIVNCTHGTIHGPTNLIAWNNGLHVDELHVLTIDLQQLMSHTTCLMQPTML